MIEIVNPSHPDKVADRIAGALVDLAYKKSNTPKIAVEVLIGHDNCYIIAETSEHFSNIEVRNIIDRITNNEIGEFDYIEVPQDPELAKNQANEIRCGDNGIFKGVVVDEEEQRLVDIAKALYAEFPTDGKYILNGDTLVVCQSCANEDDIKEYLDSLGALTRGLSYKINPLGKWVGGLNADSGATNRKLGSDMGKAVTGGGLHGKDISKADTSLNIMAHWMAFYTDKTCEMSCAIGDKMATVNGNSMPFGELAEKAKEIVKTMGGFEKFAEWGLHGIKFD